ncbi:MAG: hypothetical protein FWH41_06130 [Treponema sp.]|nr:hypothetical protein [Treponema sp.]
MIKKIGSLVRLLFPVMAIIAFGAGCGSNSSSRANANKPKWVSELPPKDAFWGIGFAKLQNDNLAMQTAASRARRDVAKQISVHVQEMLADYAKKSGLTDSARSVQSIENIGVELVNLQLTGAVVNARDQMPDGSWWVRVSISKDAAKKEINKIVDREMAEFTEFKTKQALEILEIQLDKTQSRPSPRSED